MSEPRLTDLNEMRCLKGKYKKPFWCTCQVLFDEYGNFHAVIPMMDGDKPFQFTKKDDPDTLVGFASTEAMEAFQTTWFDFIAAKDGQGTYSLNESIKRVMEAARNVSGSIDS